LKRKPIKNFISADSTGAQKNPEENEKNWQNNFERDGFERAANRKR
jgi:hypothetical protein